MLVLLPPSETKRPGGRVGPNGRACSAGLTHERHLGEARERVRTALEELSRDADAAAKALKLGVKNRGELEHNLRLREGGTLPAIERYTGVLYDSLDATTLDAAAREWLDAHVAVQSALFGLVRAGDPVPAYRLSAGSRLPGLGSSLKAVWRGAHADIDWSEAGFVIDLRSKDYAELAPVPEGQGVALHVVQRGPDGETRALNHFNKAAKGDLVRRLARSGARFEDVRGLLSWADGQGLEMSIGAETAQVLQTPQASRVTLVTELGAPVATARQNRTPAAG